MSDNSEIKVVIMGDIKSLVGGLEKATSSVKGATDEMGGAFGRLGGIIDNLKAPFLGIMAIAGGGKLFKDAIGETTKWASEVNKLSKTMEINLAQASAWSLALDDYGLTADNMTGVMQKLKMRMDISAESFKKHGISTRDSGGHLRSSGVVLEDIIKKYNDLGNQTDRNQLLQQLFGRSWAETIPLMKLTKDVISENAEQAKALGLTMDENGVKSAREYKIAMNDLKDIMMALQNAVGRAVIPVLKQFIDWVKGSGGDAVSVLENGIKSVIAAFYILKGSIELVVNIFRTLINLIIDGWVTAGAVVMNIIQGKFVAAWNAAKTGARQFTDDAKSGIDEYKLSVNNAADAIANLWAKKPKAKEKESPITGTLPDDTPFKSRMPEWEAELQHRRAMLAQMGGDIAQLSKDQERKYWEEIIKQAKRGSTDWVAVRNKMAALGYAVFQEQQKKEEEARKEAAAKAIEAERAASEARKALMKMELEALKSTLEIKSEIIDNKEKTDQINYKKAAEERIAIIRQIRDEEVAAIQETLMAGVASQKERIEMEARIAQIKHKATLDIMKTENQAIQQSRAKWKEFFTSLMSGFSTAIKGLINGTMSWKDALKTVLSSALDAVIDFFVQWGIKQVATYLTAQATGAATRVSEATGAAAVYGVNAAASAAAIPVYGWAMAPGVGEAAYMEGLSYAARASAAKGWDKVPSDQLAMVHRNEMVMSAPLAQGIRDMIGNGGQKAQPAQNINVNFHGVVDAKTFFSRNQEHIVGTIRDAARRGR
jgi:hypothetical protein